MIYKDKLVEEIPHVPRLRTPHCGQVLPISEADPHPADCYSAELATAPTPLVP